MDALDRLFWHLAEGGSRGAGAPAAGVLTIAEIYQQRVPYRLARSEFGFSELAEYEHALLRLLSGERGYAQLELADVQEEFAQELRSPNPILGIYRDYAGMEVRLRRPGASPPAPPPVAALPPEPGQPSGTEGAPEGCPRCGGALPPKGRVNFCPTCGEALRPVPCRGCSAELQPGWGFCVECGRDRRAAAG